MTLISPASAQLPPGQRPLPFEPPQPRRAARTLGGIERRFDVAFVARLALKEKQIQQNVRPTIAVHKWFARRPGTLFRALLLAEFGDGPLAETYYASHRFEGLRVADPFMGGGTPLLESNRLGCDVFGWDVNPMAYWVVRQEISRLDVPAYLAAASDVGDLLAARLGRLYRTRCLHCGGDASVKYFIWVKRQPCTRCGEAIDLFPGYLLAANERHPRTVLICPQCGELSEVEDRERPGRCRACAGRLQLAGLAGRSRCACSLCGEESRYPNPEAGPPQHRMVAIEYHCERCRPQHTGRFFKAPDRDDLGRLAEAEHRLPQADTSLVPEDPIPAGDETARLHRWGYRRYRDMFNSRQLLGLATLARAITEVPRNELRQALATNLSDLLRYQNMLCRYDTRVLKSLDIFSVHGFPVGLVQCESNLLGIQGPDGGANVGSGGWSNIVEKFARAKRYGDEPFELRYGRGGKRVVPVPGEWIGEQRDGERRRVALHCASATEARLEPASLDAVLIDPPYFANVQYAELMDFCHAWLRRLVGLEDAVFAQAGAHRPGDLTGNQTLERGLEHFTAGLSRVFQRFARALKPGRPFVFTYHHNALEAYHPVAVALLDAGLVVTATLPCPAEMGGSIHIHKSDSSIVDTVFVCRATGALSRHLRAETAADLAGLVAADLDELRRGGVEPTQGDARCIAFGHLVRLAVARLREDWLASAPWYAEACSYQQRACQPSVLRGTSLGILPARHPYPCQTPDPTQGRRSRQDPARRAHRGCLHACLEGAMALKLATDIKGIGQVLTSHRLAVPVHQRSFAWTDEKVRQLWDDLDRARHEEPQGYFIGPMVLGQPDAGATRLSVIDGQQRLATVSLLFAAMAAVLRLKGEVERAELLEKTYLGVKDFKTLEREPKLILGEDDDRYFRVLTDAAARGGDLPKPDKASQVLLRKAYDELCQRLMSEAVAADATLVQRFDEIREFLDEFVQVIVVTVASEENAFLIFETLNDRGLRLNTSDLLKNHLFGKAANRLDVVRKSWTETMAALEAMEEDDIAPMFLRHYWISSRGMVREKELYRVISSQVRSATAVVELAANLARSAEWYAALANPAHALWHGSRVRSALATLLLFRVTTPRPLLLAALEELPAKDFEGFVAAVERWSVRMAIAGGLGSGPVEEAYGQAARDVRDKQIRTPQDLRAALSRVVPQDDEFERAFAVRAIKNPKQLRYLLRRLEEQVRSERGHGRELVPTADEETLTLEHVIPRGREPDSWEGRKLEERRPFVDRIGNTCLMLRSSNKAVGASSLADKKAGYAHSQLLLTQELGQAREWTPEAIARRQEQLARLAVRVWPV